MLFEIIFSKDEKVQKKKQFFLYYVSQIDLILFSRRNCLPNIVEHHENNFENLSIGGKMILNVR